MIISIRENHEGSKSKARGPISLDIQCSCWEKRSSGLYLEVFNHKFQGIPDANFISPASVSIVIEFCMMRLINETIVYH